MFQNLKKCLCLILSLQMASGCSFLARQTKEITESIKPQQQALTPTDSQESEDSYTTYDLPAADSNSPSTTSLPIKTSHQAKLKLKSPAGPGFMGGATGAGSLVASALGSVSHKRVAEGIYAESAAYDYAPPNYEVYDTINENTFQTSLAKPLSTFSIDVDTASYSNMRRMLQQSIQPPKDAIRIEELINYFNYDYALPEKGPFAVNMELAPALWNKKHKIVRIGIKGKEIKVDQRPASNLVFLVDVSGSMDSPERLPLVKSSLTMLVDKLGANDKISIVVYAGAAGLVLAPTSGDQKMKIIRALDQMKAGGGTNGSGGIELAYKTAKEQFIKGGVNRVILATDGDFNVGVTNREDLVKLVESNAKKNIYLTILGFGMGNYKDGTMETLSNKGNGNYAYIDTQAEARKVMVEQLSGTLVTIAKDVKIQVEFNPKFVQSYRLIGYENRALKNEEFNDDKKDAGDIGAGHTVTALYEVIPVGAESSSDKIDALKYQKASASTPIESNSNDWLTLKLRYKKPDGDFSTKMEFTLQNAETKFDHASESFRFASAVALFGMILRNSEHVQEGNLNQVLKVAKNSKGNDKNSYRQEFIELVQKSQSLKSNSQNLGGNGIEE